MDELDLLRLYRRDQAVPDPVARRATLDHLRWLVEEGPCEPGTTENIAVADTGILSFAEGRERPSFVTRGAALFRDVVRPGRGRRRAADRLGDEKIIDAEAVLAAVQVSAQRRGETAARQRMAVEHTELIASLEAEASLRLEMRAAHAAERAVLLQTDLARHVATRQGLARSLEHLEAVRSRFDNEKFDASFALEEASHERWATRAPSPLQRIALPATVLTAAEIAMVTHVTTQTFPSGLLSWGVVLAAGLGALLTQFLAGTLIAETINRWRPGRRQRAVSLVALLVFAWAAVFSVATASIGRGGTQPSPLWTATLTTLLLIAGATAVGLWQLGAPARARRADLEARIRTARRRSDKALVGLEAVRRRTDAILEQIEQHHVEEAVLTARAQTLDVALDQERRQRAELAHAVAAIAMVRFEQARANPWAARRGSRYAWVFAALVFAGTIVLPRTVGVSALPAIATAVAAAYVMWRERASEPVTVGAPEQTAVHWVEHRRITVPAPVDAATEPSGEAEAAPTGGGKA